MIGFDHDILADVNLITDNLRDRYKDRFSILKELVQNADDARAERLRLGIVPGNPGSIHPLLRGPGLVAVNDGVFEEKDYRAIRKFGLNSKAADSATIGKFGLGMKSVFHLCEAFFFLAEGEGRVYRELLSPWGTGFHADWDMSDASWDHLLESLRQDSLGAVQWESGSSPFILYLPLRRKGHLQLPNGKEAGAIIENYPGDTGTVAELLRAEDTGPRLASLLPLLRDLRSIQVFLPAATAEGAQLVHSDELGSDPVRPLRHHVDGRSPLSSSLRIAQNGATTRHLRCMGWQNHRFTPRLTEIRESPAWPASWVRDALGQEQKVLDKAQPHAAAIFGQEYVPGHLIIRWAVFLPIDEHEEVVSLKTGSGGYSLTLHGNFFVDAGRNGLYGLDADISEPPDTTKDEAWVRRRWNQEVAWGSTLDLVIPALDEFARVVGLSDERASALAGALESSGLWKKRKQYIAANHKWIHTIDRTGCRWRMIGTEATLPIPEAPADDAGRPWRVFPTLDALCEHVVFFDSGANHLVSSEKELGSWDEEQVVFLLDGVSEGSVFSSKVEAEYLAAFLERLGPPVIASSPVQVALCNLLRRSAATNGLQILKGVASRVTRIACLVKQDRKLRIELRNLHIAEFLIQQPTVALVWPKELDSAGEPGIPEAADVERLLVAVAARTDESESCRQYAEYLLRQLSDQERRALLPNIGALAILSALDGQRGQRISVSANDLVAAWRRRTLFRTSLTQSEQRRSGFATILQKVIPDDFVFVINAELANIILGEESKDVPNCDARGALHCLAYTPRRLAGVGVRRELLQEVRLPDREELTVRGLRFLLHASEQHLCSDVLLWVEYGESSAWRKMWEAVIPPAERWSLVDVELASLLAPADWQTINLHPIVPDNVVGLVSERDAEKLSSVSLDREEYNAVLVYGWATSVWKSLPFHETANGERIAIADQGTYLEQPGVGLPEELLARAQIILRSPDPQLAAIQDRNIERLDHSIAIRLAITDDTPHRWCDFILDTLTRWSPTTQFLRSIGDKPWLRLQSGRAVAPRDFIVLPKLESQITEIAASTATFGTPTLLPDDLRTHRTFELVGADLFPLSNSLDALDRMIGSATGFAVGVVVIEKTRIRDVAAILKSAPPQCPVRGWQIVSAVCESYGEEAGAKLLSSLARPVSIEQVKGVLRWLPDQEELPGTPESFDAYLSLLVALGQGKAVLASLRLRALDGSWQPADRLCDDVPGVAPSAVVSLDHSEILKPLLETSLRADYHAIVNALDDRETIEVVRGYFAPWMQRGGLEAQIGALVTLFAGGKELKDYAANALFPHTQEWLLKEVRWTKIEPLPFGATRQMFDGMTLEQAIAHCSLRVRVVNVQHIRVHSLLGLEFDAPAEKKAGQLLVGKPYLTSVAGQPPATVQLRETDLTRFSDPELSSMLRRTAEEVLRCVYLQGIDLKNVWDHLDSAEQFDVKIAEQLILDSLPFYLRQLKPQNAFALTTQLRRIEECRRLVAEFQVPPAVQGVQHIPSIYLEKRKDLDAALQKLREMLRSNQEAQAGVLNAVRNKLRDSQYQVSSIPFELFQNADDAYVELREIRSTTHQPGSDRNDAFVVVRANDTLSFLHWGRPINWIGSNGFDGRKRGYDRDLEKMLILSSSEKQLSVENGQPAHVTGKFGLGFKSVLLACDRPLLSSGNLQVEILGGILPKQLSRDEAQPLRQLLGSYGAGTKSTGTLVQMRQVTPDVAQKILAEFFRTAGYLCAFGLSIREITYVDESGPHPTTWSGTAVGGNHAVERGKLPAGSLTDPDTLSALRIQLDSGVVLFGIGPRGAITLPKGTPAVWVTGPTREDENFGFAVCAMFDVDPGRARLSASDGDNAILAERLGHELGSVLRALRGSDWARVHQDLGLAPETVEYNFWNSLWSLLYHVITRPETTSRKIMLRLIETAFSDIACDVGVVPNGLPGNLQALTTAPSVHYKLGGALTIDGCVTPLFGWQTWLQRGLSRDSVVSARSAEGLRQMRFNDLPTISLTTIASWLTSRTIRPDDARVLGEVLQALPKEIDRKQEIIRDLEDARKMFSLALFQSKGNTNERAVDLVVSGGEDDESHRAAFAPKGQQLSSDYDDAGVMFFKFCRRQMDAPAEDLAGWAVDAEGALPRRAVLNYLLRGELRTEVQECVRHGGIDGTWLEVLAADDPWVVGLTGSQLDELRYRILPGIEQLRSNNSPPADAMAPPRERNPLPILQRIEDWWSEHRTEHLRQYEERFYPNGAPQLTAPGDPGFDRHDWLVLFGRAALYRMGRARDGQHRSYIKLAQDKGWWGVFSAEHPKRNAVAWMGVLDEFYEAQLDEMTWEHWVQSFPTIYKLSRWLESYAELFLDLDRQDGRYDLDVVLRPRADSMLQGGGIDAPPLGLGIGACFVVRELLRLRHINNGFAHEHAFVPTKQLRDMLNHIGLEIDDEPSLGVASQIYSQIAGQLTPERARFGGAYDIPFRVIAEKPELQQRLLGGFLPGAS